MENIHTIQLVQIVACILVMIFGGATLFFNKKRLIFGFYISFVLIIAAMLYFLGAWVLFGAYLLLSIISLPFLFFRRVKYQEKREISINFDKIVSGVLIVCLAAIFVIFGVNIETAAESEQAMLSFGVLGKVWDEYSILGGVAIVVLIWTISLALRKKNDSDLS